MISVIKSEDRHSADHGWLQTYWHFSFSDYHDPAEHELGPPARLQRRRRSQAGGGFAMHPHRDMEIVTYVVEGSSSTRTTSATAGSSIRARCR